MDTHRKKNLKIKSQSLGEIFIEPQTINTKDIQNAKIIIYPAPFAQDRIQTVVEWAAGTQAPFFCHVQELKKLKDEGFGLYRFQKLDTFKEVDFLAGSIEFFPSRTKKHSGFKGWIQEVKEIFGFKKIPGFHLIIKPRKEQQVLYLSHPFIDHIEWTLLTKGDPIAIIGSEHFSRETWQQLSAKFRRPILYVEDVLTVDTYKGSIEFSEGGEERAAKAKFSQSAPELLNSFEVKIEKLE